VAVDVPDACVGDVVAVDVPDIEGCTHNLHVYVCVGGCMYTYVYMRTCIHKYIHKYMHTHDYLR